MFSNFIFLKDKFEVSIREPEYDAVYICNKSKHIIQKSTDKELLVLIIQLSYYNSKTNERLLKRQ